MKKQKYYEVIGMPGDGKQYKLGFTSNKSAFQKNSGWPMKWLKFIARTAKNPLSGSHPEMLPDAGKVVSLGNPMSARVKQRLDKLYKHDRNRLKSLVEQYYSVVDTRGASKGTLVSMIMEAEFGKEWPDKNPDAGKVVSLGNPRPPKGWFTRMRRGVASRYKRFGKERIDRIVAGIWWKLPESTRKRLIRQYDNPFVPTSPYRGKLAEEIVVAVPGKELGVLVNRKTGKVTNRWEDGTAGVPRDIKDMAAEEVEAHDPWRKVYYEWRHKNPTRAHTKRGIGFLGLAAIAGLAYLIWKNRSQ